MDNPWYYAKNGQRFGPVSGSELNRLSAAGALGAEDLVWRDGMTSWMPAEAIGLGSRPQESPSSPAPPAIPCPPAIPSPPPGPVVPPPHPSAAPFDLPSKNASAFPVAPPPLTSQSIVAIQEARPAAALPRTRRSWTPLVVGWLAGAATMAIIGVGIYLLILRQHQPALALRAGGAAPSPPGETPKSQAASASRVPSSQPQTVDEPGAAGSPDRTSLAATRGADKAPAVASGAPPAAPDSESGTPAPPNTAPPNTAPPNTAPPNTAPPNTAPPNTAPPNTAPPTQLATNGATNGAANGTTTRAAAPGDAAPPPVAALPSAPSSPNASGEAASGAKTRRGEFFQVIDIHRQPVFEIRGATIAQEIRYQVLSRIHVGAPDAEGRQEATQYVFDTRLAAADDLTRAAFAGALEQLRRQQYTFTLDASNKVVQFTGHKDNRQLVPANVMNNNGLAMTSVIDRDGWRELAELTFFRANEKLEAGRSWKRPMTHDWGALGSWSGVTTFARASAGREISFQHEMQYAPPPAGNVGGNVAGNVAGAAGPLGLRILRSHFQPQEASGTLQLDEDDRVVLATERFAVQGALEVELLGQPATIALVERQAIHVQVFDENPWQTEVQP